MKRKENKELDEANRDGGYRIHQMHLECSYKALLGKYLEEIYSVRGDILAGDEPEDPINLMLKGHLNCIQAIREGYSGSSVPVAQLLDGLGELEKLLQAEIDRP